MPPTIAFELGEDFIRKKRPYYQPGKYKTMVIVYEGRVAMSPYDEKGMLKNKSILLADGKKGTQTGVVK